MTHVSSHSSGSARAGRFAGDGKRFAPLVDRIAKGVVRRVPSSIEKAELVNVGWVGLLEASARAPANMNGVEFEHFAACRVKGAMLDHLRSLSPAARERRNSARRISRGMDTARNTHGRAPTDDEVAAAMGQSVESYRSEIERGARQSFHMVDIDDANLASTSGTPESNCEKKQMVDLLAGAVASLPLRSQQILSLYYQDECTMSEIGAVLGVSESRVSQLMTGATHALKTQLEVS